MNDVQSHKMRIIRRFLAELDKRLESRDLSGAKELLERLSPSELTLPIFKKRLAACNYYEGNLEAAASLYQALIGEMWDDRSSHVNAFKTLVKMGRLEDALATARLGLSRFEREVDFALELAHFLFFQKKYDLLFQYTSELVGLFQDWFDILWLRANAQLYGRLNDNGERDFERCLSLIQQNNKPMLAETLMSLVRVYYRNSRDDKLEDALKHALENRGEKISHYTTLLEYLEKTGDIHGMETLITEALSKFPSNDEIILYEIIYLRRTGRKEELAQRVWNISIDDDRDINVRIKLHQEKARFFESNAKFHEAFVHYTSMNSLAIQRQGGVEEVDRICDIKNKSIETWESLIPAMAHRYRDRSKCDTGESQIFFVGFPRSGTTLVDQILTSHPDIEVIEEKPILRQVIDRIKKAHGCFPGPMMLSMGPEEIESYQSIYQDTLAHFCKTDRPVVVNKLPLNIIHLPLIFLLFPQARIIVAIRHPMDSILSCYFQLFEYNSAMANFLSLEGSVEFYNKVMSSYLMVQKLYRHDLLHVFRYEDLVNDIRGEVIKILSFLGLPWDDVVLNFHETARKRGVINTPSYTQVTQPLYNNSVYKWKNYAEEVGQYMPALEKFIQAFGYE